MLYNTANLSKSVPVCRILKSDQIRRVSTPVDLANPERAQELIWKMVRTCVANNGVGLAAPQIGVFKRVFIAEDSPGLFRAYINPTYKVEGTRMIEDFEACLSVSSKRIKISRPDIIYVSWSEINPDGTTQEMAGTRRDYQLVCFSTKQITWMAFPSWNDPSAKSQAVSSALVEDERSERSLDETGSHASNYRKPQESQVTQEVHSSL